MTDAPTNDRRSTDQERGHVPLTAREVDAPTGDDYDHTGHDRHEDEAGGNRGGGDPTSTLGR